MSGVQRVLVLLCLLAVLPLAQLAQAQTVVTAGPDSTQVRQTAVADSSRRTEKLLGFRVTRPQKAAFLALAIPGAGQIYNHRYWKLPLVYGALGGVGYGLFHYQSRYKEYVKGKQEYRTVYGPGQDPYVEGTPLSKLSGANVSQEIRSENIERGIVFYRRYRDTFIAYTALAYGITILDALVDAHLRDFDISEDLSLRLDPAALPSRTAVPGAGLAVSLYWR
ncbi:DUF5683 domain-containing protein [Hymenobacter sp. AT01-02]|uniref:DUF5683 domain-containing protein n=1 Tax=Hymenobacter sp. AT01-02 TaxID=1571877 RepID=UPI000A75311D|nr:DUF5683 domain-containing protein [Hymenobacter sp. AT01-02]